MEPTALSFNSLLNRPRLLGATVVTSPPAPEGWVWLFGMKKGSFLERPDVPDKGQRWSRNHSRENGFKDTEAPRPRFEPTAAILEYRRAQAISICSLDSITFAFD